MTKYWFKPKRYGIGSMPSSWEGWATVAGFIAFVLWSSIYAEENTKLFVILMTVAIGVIILISYKKTEGGWHWQWGDKKK